MALYVLGSGDFTCERVRSKLNISYGSVYDYVDRTVELLQGLATEYIAWPSAESRRRQREEKGGTIFEDCVGYLDGSEIPLKMKPEKDSETFFSRKKIYDLNLQAICDYGGKFTYATIGTRPPPMTRPLSSRPASTPTSRTDSKTASFSWPTRLTSS